VASGENPRCINHLGGMGNERTPSPLRAEGRKLFSLQIVEMKKSPGRPRTTTKAPKNKERNRKYTIVIHDLPHTDYMRTKRIVSDWIDGINADWSLVGCEKYNKVETNVPELLKGYDPENPNKRHCHVFIKYPGQIARYSVHQQLEKVLKDNECIYSRDCVKPGLGNYEECLRYLKGGTKEKDIDNNVIHNVRRQSKQEIYDGLAVKYPGETQKCEICNKSVFVGKPMLYKTSGGDVREIISPAYCWICQKIKLSENIRTARPELFSQEIVS